MQNVGLQNQKRRREHHHNAAWQDECANDYIAPDMSSTLYRFAIWITAAHLAAGTSFYMLAEGWEWQDSLYFCTVTLLTVGYGDYVPTSNMSKLFTICYILLGLSFIATCLGLLFGQLQDKIQASSGNHFQKFIVALMTIVVCIGRQQTRIALSKLLVHILTHGLCAFAVVPHLSCGVRVGTYSTRYTGLWSPQPPLAMAISVPSTSSLAR